jgi:peptidoglycan hydrolase-like protein with peptidoglycan-binding domain
MGALQLGSSGRAVEFLQSRLGVAVDGSFGSGTQDALKAAQTARGLTADGVYGPVTNKALTARSNDAIAQCAQHFGVESAAFGAVVQVEAAGVGFLPDGRPQILLERLYVYRQASPEQRRMLSSNVCAPQPGGYFGGDSEWTRFETVANVLGIDDATQCCSWGLGQIMGANWRAAGASDVADFRTRMVQDESHQLALMAGFIASQGALAQALRSKNWTAFAYHYNGPSYAQNSYDRKLAAAYETLSKV